MNRKKFQVGEKIFCAKNGEGEVTGYGYNHLFGDEEYIVKWDNGREETYEQGIADSTWSYVLNESNTLPTGKKKASFPKSMELLVNGKPVKGLIETSMSYIPVSVTISKEECSHKETVDVGFMHTKLVCKKCNKEISN